MDKLESLGPRGIQLLEDLKKEMDKMEHPTNESDLTNTESKLQRMKRHIEYTMNLGSDLMEDDEKGNSAIEDGFVPDGEAKHHGIINEETMNDNSKSEFWSSFSSSEEALLNCAGLILSLPLTPHMFCHNESRAYSKFTTASFANTITYTAPVNGYYFFVFSSENEIQDNYIRVHFDLKKTVYNVSNPVRECHNETEKCSMALDFFSDEKVVFEMPLSDNESMWNEQYFVASECEPRTIVYLICVLSVPILILLFAFQ